MNHKWKRQVMMKWSWVSMKWGVLNKSLSFSMEREAWRLADEVKLRKPKVIAICSTIHGKCLHECQEI